MSTIFISKSSKDNAWAERIAAWLKDEQQQRSAEHRYDSLFLDFDPEDGIPQGQSWRATLYRKLQVCRAVIVVCSRHYCASQWCLAELGIAIHEGKLVLPVRIDKQKDHSDLPRLLSETQAWVLEAIDLQEGSVTGCGGLERGLEGLSWRERLTWKVGQCPYPGLPAFSRTFAPVFFGRDAAITRVQQKLNGLAERSPAFLLLLGAFQEADAALVFWREEAIREGLDQLRHLRDFGGRALLLVLDAFRQLAIALAAPRARIGRSSSRITTLVSRVRTIHGCSDRTVHVVEAHWPTHRRTMAEQILGLDHGLQPVTRARPSALRNWLGEIGTALNCPLVAPLLVREWMAGHRQPGGIPARARAPAGGPGSGLMRSTLGASLGGMR